MSIRRHLGQALRAPFDEERDQIRGSVLGLDATQALDVLRSRMQETLRDDFGLTDDDALAAARLALHASVDLDVACDRLALQRALVGGGVASRVAPYLRAAATGSRIARRRNRRSPDPAAPKALDMSTLGPADTSRVSRFFDNHAE